MGRTTTKRTAREALEAWHRGVRLGPGEQSALVWRGLLTGSLGEAARLTPAGERLLKGQGA
jgi:hypothetical protein